MPMASSRALVIARTIRTRPGSPIPVTPMDPSLLIRLNQADLAHRRDAVIGEVPGLNERNENG